MSVLEGGYRIQGGIVSAFGRSVAGHVRALVDGCESRQASRSTLLAAAVGGGRGGAVVE